MDGRAAAAHDRLIAGPRVTAAVVLSLLTLGTISFLLIRVLGLA
jgi:hypothetical protein